MKQEIFNNLKKVLENHYELSSDKDCERIQMTTNLKHEFCADSFDLCSIMVMLEDEYNVCLTGEDSVEIMENATVENIVNVFYRVINKEK